MINVAFHMEIFILSQNIFPVFHRLQFFWINNNKLRFFVTRNIIAYITRKNEKKNGREN